jgi:hypothetical protein
VTEREHTSFKVIDLQDIENTYYFSFRKVKNIISEKGKGFYLITEVPCHEGV